MAQRESIANRGYSRQDPLINTNRNTFRTHHHDTPLMTTYRQPSIISSHHPTPNSAAIYSPYHNHHQPLSIMPLQQPQQQPRREEITRWSTHQPPPPNRVLSSRQQYPQTASRNLGPPSPHQSSLLASTQNKARESETPKSSTPSTTKKNQSVKPTPSPKISKTVVDPNRPALLVPDPIPVDHDFEEMSSGLKLQQQEWSEKNELKRVISDVTRLVDCLQSIMNGSVRSFDGLKSLLESSLLQHLESLRMRVISKIHCIEIMNKDIEGLVQELSIGDHYVSNLRDTELATISSELHRAKKRKRYHIEFERLAGECLAKKPKSVYAEEQAKEEDKLVKVQQSTAMWKEIGEFRNRQVDVALHHVKELLESLKNPETVIELLKQAKEKESEEIEPETAQDEQMIGK